MTDSTTTRAPMASPGGPCRCSWAQETDHDDILAAGHDLERLMSVMENKVGWRHTDNFDMGRVAPFDLPDFVATHNWPDPLGMTYFAGLVELLWRSQVPTDKERQTNALAELRKAVVQLAAGVEALELRVEENAAEARPGA